MHADGLETLCGQSYGVRQYHMLGIYVQRSWIILSACAVAMLPVYLFTSRLLVFLGQDQAIYAAAGTIALWYIPIMLSSVWSYTLQMYLQAQSKNAIITCIAFLNLGVHLLSWLATARFHLGLAGVMGSNIIAMCIPAFGQLLFIFFRGCPQTWTGFSSAAFADLGAIFKLSMSSVVMLWYARTTNNSTA
ncbi:Protein TRANSPARENT TESTA 12 [Hordeum vulgare]|nr:Protein TRANSPARENT TESTA 12 [Hordeum vulgare]